MSNFPFLFRCRVFVLIVKRALDREFMSRVPLWPTVAAPPTVAAVAATADATQGVLLLDTRCVTLPRVPPAAPPLNSQS